MKLKAPKLKIKTVVFQRIGKVLLWTLVVFLILRGIGSLFRPNDAEAAKAVIENFISSREYQERVEKEASAFAEGFAIEYMTYDGKKTEDYEKRLKRYVPGYLGTLGMNIPGGAKAEVLNAESIRLTWVSEHQLNVDVKVKVRYYIKTMEQGANPGEMEQQEQVIENNSYIRIPIAEKEGKYMVEDYPGQVPAPEKADVEYSYHSGKQTDSITASEVTKVLESFFKTYYSGSAGEIAYYMLDSTKPVKGLESRYQFERIDSAGVYLGEVDSNKYFSVITLTIKDSINGQVLQQKFHAQLVKKEDRFYIDKFDVRVGNLNKSNTKNQ